MITYIEQLLSRTEKVQLSAESIKIVSPLPEQREEGFFFLRSEHTEKNTVWRTQVKGIAAGTFISGRGWLVISAATSKVKSGWRRDT